MKENNVIENSFEYVSKKINDLVNGYKKYQYKQAVEENPYVIDDVNEEMFSEEEYFNICEKAITKKPDSLLTVNANILSKENYYKLCEKAMNISISTFDNVKSNYLNEEDYYKLCAKVVNWDFRTLNKLNYKKLKEEDAEKLVLEAIKNHYEDKIMLYYVLQFVKKQTKEIVYRSIEKFPYTLKYANEELFSKEEYFNLCKEVVGKVGTFLPFVKRELFSKEEYFELANIAINQNEDATQYLIDEEVKEIKEKYKSNKKQKIVQKRC
jgi:hypothetical protein